MIDDFSTRKLDGHPCDDRWSRWSRHRSRPLVRKLGLAMLYALLALGPVPAGASIPEATPPSGDIAPACRADYPLREVVAALQPGESIECERHDLKCHEENMARLETLIAAHPNDLNLRLVYQNLHEHWPGYDRPRKEKLRLEAARALAASPGDARVRYLHARAMPPGESWELLVQAAADLPGSPWPHLDLAYLSNIAFEVQDAGRADEHLERFYALCPNPPGWTLVFGHVGFGSKEFWRSRLETVRRGVEAMPPFERVNALYHLWGLEGRVLPIDGREAFHARIRADLAGFAGLGYEERMDYWMRQAQAGRRLGDQALSREAWEQLARRFPCHTTGRLGRGRLWNLDHDDELRKVHEAFQKGERVVASDALFEMVGEWSERCPEDLAGAQARFALASALDRVDDEEFVAAGERVVTLYDQVWKLDTLIVAPYHQVARALLDRGLAPRRALELIDREVERRVEARLNSLADELYPEAMAVHRRQSRGLRDFDLEVDRLRAAVATGDVEVATAAGERTLRAMITAKELVAEGQPLRRWRRRAADAFEHRAALAELEGRPLDSVAFLLRSEALRGEHAPAVQGETVAEPRSLAVWRRQGGSEEGWQALARSIEMALDPKELADVWAWEELERPIGELSLRDLEGRLWQRTDFEDRAVLINFWATWCAPCVEELSLVQRLHERFDERDDVLVLTFNVDRDLDLVKPFLEREGFTFTTVLASDFFTDFLPVDELVLPQTWLVDRQGILRARQRGFVASEEQELGEEIATRLEDMARRAP